MKQGKWFFHPAFIFIFSILTLVLSLVLYIYWYVRVSTRLQALIQRFNLDPGQFFELQTWVVIVVLSILVGIILLGIFIIFAFQVKTLQLYRRQHNFINSFTHELKTPVTSLQLYAETFQKHELPREMQLKYIGYMLADLSRLTNNINRILSLAKIESRTYQGEFAVVDLTEVVTQFCTRNRQLFRDCELRVHRPAGEVFYRVDSGLFEMLLMNLLANGCKYNDSERPAVDIFFTRAAGKLRLQFKDNGIGFPPREGKKIFRKFYRIERPDRPQAEGSGLGLYLVEMVAKIHQGKMRAESGGEGKGATLTLILPDEAGKTL